MSDERDHTIATATVTSMATHATERPGQRGY
jgi:hypothetical protein